MEKGPPGVVLKSNRSKKAGSELTGTGGVEHPIQAWKDVIGVHDFWAALQKEGSSLGSPSLERGLASLVKERKKKSILHSTEISTQRSIETGGIIKALAIGITVWGEILLHPIIPPPAALFDPSLLLVDISCVHPIQESLTSISTSYESCKDIGIEAGSQLFDPLTILHQEKTEEERTVMVEIGQALEEKRYSYALKILAGALVLSLVLSSISKR